MRQGGDFVRRGGGFVRRGCAGWCGGFVRRAVASSQNYPAVRGGDFVGTNADI